MANKECFGILERVFPKGKSGMREIVPECFECPDRVVCLKKAMSTKEGLKMLSGLISLPAS